MKAIFPFLLCVTALYAAPVEDTAVSSANAVYDGNSLILTGHVVLDHSLGKMAADEAKLQRQENGKDFPFSLIELARNVAMNLKSGAKIECSGAELDFIKLKGLLSSSEGNKVVYSDPLKKGLLKILGNAVELKISKKDDVEKKTDFEIDTILAKDEVVIEFGQEFFLHAHKALYRKAPSEKFQGIVTAYPKDAETPCTLTHQNDFIDAESVDLDLVHSKITLLRPKGFLSSLFLPGMQKGDVKFSCDHLLWDQSKDMLLLKGHVRVLESLIGTLISEGELEIVQKEQKKQKMLKTMRTHGLTTLDFKDESGKIHRLTGHGPFLFDRDRLRATIESPKKSGVVPVDKQIYYETENLAFFANQGIVEYAPSTAGHLRPTNLSLIGNIRLFSKDQEKPRLAVADRVNLSTTTKTVILAADPGKKVLYVDKAQGLRIGAQEVHITRDAKTGEDKVQGVGNVQFAFTEEENSLLEKIQSAMKILK
jgi:hypothetical protein